MGGNKNVKEPKQTLRGASSSSLSLSLGSGKGLRGVLVFARLPIRPFAARQGGVVARPGA